MKTTSIIISLAYPVAVVNGAAWRKTMPAALNRVQCYVIWQLLLSLPSDFAMPEDMFKLLNPLARKSA